MTGFIETRNVLCINKHDLRRGLSTFTQLPDTLHEFASGINNKSQIYVLFWDQSKAFDRVVYTKLLNKLTCISGEGQIVSRIETFLENRVQFVFYGAHASWRIEVISVVPQRSISASLLFQLFINNSEDIIEANTNLFPDDCVIYRKIKGQHDKQLINDFLKKVGDWYDSW